jgi:hypothetical protein
LGKLDRTWQLFCESYTVLSKDVEILVFPLLSGVSAILLAIGFFLPLYDAGAFEAIRRGRGLWPHYAALFAWYYANFFVGIFFNGALAACANIRLAGGDPTVRDGLRLAFRRIGRIALWALIAATVGLLLSSVRNRRNWILRLLGASLELAWTLITYLIVPVLLFEERGVYDSIYRSEELFHQHWGEQVAGSFGFGLLTTLLCLPAFGIAALLWDYDRALGICMAGSYLLILAVVSSAVKGVFTVALYRYATEGEAPSGFSADVIDDVLGGRRPRSWSQGSGFGY